jgi:hypothetical protein
MEGSVLPQHLYTEDGVLKATATVKPGTAPGNPLQGSPPKRSALTETCTTENLLPQASLAQLGATPGHNKGHSSATHSRVQPAVQHTVKSAVAIRREQPFGRVSPYDLCLVHYLASVIGGSVSGILGSAS